MQRFEEKVLNNATFRGGWMSIEETVTNWELKSFDEAMQPCNIILLSVMFTQNKVEWNEHNETDLKNTT